MKYILFLFLALLGINLFAQNHQTALQQLLKTNGLKHAAVTLSIKQVDGRKNILEHNPQTALTPASILKIIPTWIALQQKGANYQYNTCIYTIGTIANGTLNGSIRIVASGDPTLESRHFPQHTLVQPLITALQNAGIKQIQGNIYIETTQRTAEIPGSWAWEDISNAYATVYQPFNYQDNTFTLYLSSANPGDTTQLLDMAPQQPNLHIHNQITASTIDKDLAYLYGGPLSNQWVAKGTIPAHRSAYTVKGAMPNPAAACIVEITRQCYIKGIKINNQPTPEQPPQLLLTISSPTLAEIITNTNQISNNLFAEALGQLATNGQSPQNIKPQLYKNSLDTTAIIIADVCGLSHRNALSASVLTDLLIYIAQQPSNEAFLHSLPIAGTSPGLHLYTQQAPQLNNRLQAKTGSMTGIRALAGYLTTIKGEKLAFTIIINNYTCPPRQLQQAVGKFLQNIIAM